jgi:hypothetical protein
LNHLFLKSCSQPVAIDRRSLLQNIFLFALISVMYSELYCLSGGKPGKDAIKPATRANILNLQVSRKI